ncbi:serine/threonine protein kinase [Bacillus sp. DNRA2]|uniref:protein kinase domain-containing protein n=1 Tax=Bacillus sp. DNRA2 TaxID=2723053 RepID=UPI00145DF375|nr:serine/threonine-protein kinase [Bacillus sp. DNRA2]NMD72206.1 serine/threonine protein kinase [Bacillus sp. DNRA2]
MMNHSLKSQCKVNPGTIIEGKWHQNRYTIVKELGNGANGIVYLARAANQKQVAIKMSDNSMSITSEVNVLKSFAKVQGSTLGPSLLDVDDWVRRTGKISFYVMEYIEGPDLLSYIQKKGQEWTNVLILQLLSDLDQLHQNGWVFGDLKPENLIVSGPPPQIRCIDVGGTTIKGRAIKEYTEFFDRGYWGLGSRKAEPSYDLFAVAMIMINTIYPKRFKKTSGGILQLKEMIRQKSELRKLDGVLLNALQGNYNSAGQMRTDMLNTLKHVPRQTQQAPSATRKTNSTKSRAQHTKRKKKSNTIETLVIAAIIVTLYTIYIFGQLLP